MCFDARAPVSREGAPSTGESHCTSAADGKPEWANSWGRSMQIHLSLSLSLAPLLCFLSPLEARNRLLFKQIRLFGPLRHGSGSCKVNSVPRLLRVKTEALRVLRVCRAYDNAAIKCYGKDAVTNFDPSIYVEELDPSGGLSVAISQFDAWSSLSSHLMLQMARRNTTST